MACIPTLRGLKKTKSPILVKKRVSSSTSRRHLKSAPLRTIMPSPSLPSQQHQLAGSMIDTKPKRVSKACERCQMRKTKCDRQFPCKKCKDDGRACTAGNRKKTELKQLSRGYIEALENTQDAMMATVQKLYNMVRNGESWELDEPELNDRNLPVVHDIVAKLGCIRLSSGLIRAIPGDSKQSLELQNQIGISEKEGGDESRNNIPEHPALSSQSTQLKSKLDFSYPPTHYQKEFWHQQQQQYHNYNRFYANQYPVFRVEFSMPFQDLTTRELNFRPTVEQEPQSDVRDRFTLDQRSDTSLIHGDVQGSLQSLGSLAFNVIVPFGLTTQPNYSERK